MPDLTTVLKALATLGKTLYIGDLKRQVFFVNYYKTRC